MMKQAGIELGTQPYNTVAFVNPKARVLLLPFFSIYKMIKNFKLIQIKFLNTKICTVYIFMKLRYSTQSVLTKNLRFRAQCCLT